MESLSLIGVTWKKEKDKLRIKGLSIPKCRIESDKSNNPLAFKMITWKEAILLTLLNHYRVADHVSLTQLYNRHLKHLVQLTGSMGRTPDATLRSHLQSLRSEGYIAFLHDLGEESGNYIITRLPTETDFNRLRRIKYRGERMVAEILDSLLVDASEFKSMANHTTAKDRSQAFEFQMKTCGYAMQVSFEGMVYKSNLYYDFYLEFRNGSKIARAAIEFQGIQHEIAVKYFGCDKGLAVTIVRDLTKVRFSAENDISLLLVKTYDKESEADNIKQFLNNIRRKIGLNML